MNQYLELNADLSVRVVVRSANMDWERSPANGVWRKRLYLDGPPESGRVTSIVRYDAGSSFAVHAHPDGEEILVLDGVFSDEHGDYPAGSYLLNPDGTSHAPRSAEGCSLFVRLRQYAGAGRQQLRLDTAAMGWLPWEHAGSWHKPLYRQTGFAEWSGLIKLDPGVEGRHHAHPRGEEIFVLDGVMEDEFGRYPAGTWLRNPPGSAHRPTSSEGAIVFVRVGGME